MMRKFKLFWVFVLLVGSILTLGPGSTLAEGPIKLADEQSPTRETTRQEVIDTETGPRLATIVESVTDRSIPVKNRNQDSGEGMVIRPDSVHYVGSVTVTLWRELSWWQDGDLWRARTRGRTTTDQCVDQANVWAAHELYHQDTEQWVEEFNSGNYLSSGPCHNDSGIAPTAAGLYIADQNHRSRGVHVAYVSGQRHEWDETGPESVIP